MNNPDIASFFSRMKHPAQPYARIVFILALYFLLFFVARVALWTIYPAEFASLNLADTLWSFIYGIRFDASSIVSLAGIPLLMLLLPFRFAHTRLWQQLWLWLLFAILLYFVLALVGDLIYFGFVQRHVGAEITLITGDIGLMWDIAKAEHSTALLVFVICAIVAGVVWQRLFTPSSSKTPSRLPRLLMVLGLLMVFLVVGRGGFQYKPIGVADAFAAGSASAGYLAMNGAFAIQHSLLSSQPKKANFMPLAQAIDITRASVLDANESWVNDTFPLLRAKTNVPPTSPPNIVVIMFESWDAIHTDALRQQRHMAPLQVTPVFDALANQGMLFDRFYAAGRRSMDGLAAMLAGMPTLPAMPYIGNGLEQSRLGYIGDIARQQGYETFFLQSSNRGSFHIDAIATQAGFTRYLGAEDIAQDPQYPQASQWGVWDRDTFREANSLFTQSKKPFFGFIFTSTTHNPWRVPDKRWEKYPPQNDRNHYLNSLYYADWALGELMADAKKAGYYDNTIFVFTGDHIGPFDVTPGDVLGGYNIPLLIVGPGIAAGINHRIGSQLDVPATIMDIAGWSTTHASIGRSLRSTIEQSHAFSVNGNLINWIDDKGWITHDLQHVITTSTSLAASDAQTMEQQLLATYQTTLQSLLDNTVFRPSNH